MNDLYEIWLLINQYPACVPFYMFLLTAFLMIISFFSGLDTDSDLHLDVHLLDDILVSSGISKVPLVIGLCLTFMPMTIISLFIQDPVFNLLRNMLPDIAYYVVATVALVVLFVVCLYIGGFLSAPIAKFIHNNTSYHVDYIGQEAVVWSKNVNMNYGEIKCIINDSHHMLSAYSEDTIGEDTKVTIVKYDEDKQKYLIVKKA